MKQRLVRRLESCIARAHRAIRVSALLLGIGRTALLLAIAGLLATQSGLALTLHQDSPSNPSHDAQHCAICLHLTFTPKTAADAAVSVAPQAAATHVAALIPAEVPADPITSTPGVPRAPPGR